MVYMLCNSQNPLTYLFTGGDGVMVHARVLNCVDGVNLALLQRGVNEQRSYFRERGENKGDATTAAQPRAPL